MKKTLHCLTAVATLLLLFAPFVSTGSAVNVAVEEPMVSVEPRRSSTSGVRLSSTTTSDAVATIQTVHCFGNSGKIIDVNVKNHVGSMLLFESGIAQVTSASGYQEVALNGWYNVPGSSAGTILPIPVDLAGSITKLTFTGLRFNSAYATTNLNVDCSSYSSTTSRLTVNKVTSFFGKSMTVSFTNNSPYTILTTLPEHGTVVTVTNTNGQSFDTTLDPDNASFGPNKVSSFTFKCSYNGTLKSVSVSGLNCQEIRNMVMTFPKTASVEADVSSVTYSNPGIILWVIIGVAVAGIAVAIISVAVKRHKKAAQE